MSSVQHYPHALSLVHAIKYKSFFSLVSGGLANEGETTSTRPGLNSDILSLLGAEVSTDITYGAPIHQDVGDRWLHIIKMGLDGEGNVELIKKYPAPENAKNFGAPKLNPLVKHAALNLVIKRDERLASQQTQISASLSAISKAMTILLNKEGGEDSQNSNSKDVIEQLSDAGRLLADIHHTFSMSRRDLVSLNLNKDLKDPLMESPIDEWLFGEDLNERLKTAKDLQVSSKQLLTAKQPTKRASTSKEILNWKGPPQNFRGAKRGGPHNQAPMNPKFTGKYRPAHQKHSKYRDEKKSRRH